MQDLWQSIPDSIPMTSTMRIDLDALSGLTRPQPLKIFLHYMREILPRYRLHCLHQKASKIDTNCGRNCGQIFGVNEILRCGWILTGKTATETAISSD